MFWEGQPLKYDISSRQPHLCNGSQNGHDPGFSAHVNRGLHTAVQVPSHPYTPPRVRTAQGLCYT